MKVRANLFIILVSVIFPLTLAITYTTALINKDIIPFWPYISHTGDDPIESCIFSLGLNIVSGLYALIVYLRFVQIRYLLVRDSSKFRKYLNRSSLFWGMVAAFTLSMTCSFQQRSISAVHLVSAVTCSYTALAYFWHQTMLCRLCARWMTKRVRTFRMALSIASTVIHGVAPILFMYTLFVHPMPNGKITEWDSNVETMAIYLIGSLMEWSVFVLNELYIGSFYWEFQNIGLKMAEIVMKLMALFRVISHIVSSYAVSGAIHLLPDLHGILVPGKSV